MDPVTITAAAADASATDSHLLLAAIVAVTVGMMEVLKTVVSKLGPKKGGGNDAIASIAASMARVSEAQERLAQKLGNLDMAFSAHDKSDAVVFTKMLDSLVRIEETADSNAQSLTGFSKDFESALKKLDELARKHDEHDRRVMEAVAIQKDIKDRLRNYPTKP